MRWASGVALALMVGGCSSNLSPPATLAPAASTGDTTPTAVRPAGSTATPAASAFAWGGVAAVPSADVSIQPTMRIVRVSVLQSCREGALYLLMTDVETERLYRVGFSDCPGLRASDADSVLRQGYGLACLVDRKAPGVCAVVAPTADSVPSEPQEVSRVVLVATEAEARALRTR